MSGIVERSSLSDRGPPVRTLYFDFDGTLLVHATNRPKAALTGGAFEAAVRTAGFERLICVGSFVTVIHELAPVRPDYDGLGAIFALSRGTFTDEAWFRAHVGLVPDPAHRAAAIPLDSDWWYVDDLALEFMARDGLAAVSGTEMGRRILAPDPYGDGSDILQWLSTKCSAR